MAGNNPVFGRIQKQLQDEQGYAGFGQQRTQQQGSPQQPGYYPPTPMSPEQLDAMYQRPSAGPLDTGRVTFDDVIMKTLTLFAIVLGSAGVAWVLTATAPRLTLPIWLGGMFGGLVIGLVIGFMKKVSVPLILLYSVLEGGFLGAFSRYIESIPSYRGIVPTAVVATLCTFAGMFLGYRAGFIKVTSKSRRIFGMAALGYFLFSLVNVLGLFMGWTSGWGFGGSSMIGIGLSVLGVGLASYSLAIDFDSVEQGVRMGAPQKYSWLFAHGLIVSLVWLYIEIVRLLARLRD
ncbi:MAG: Bax inhibitor-1/YccA family protein [Actinomycetales bacterium]|jgi:uncharacterized YccA/Bax inhibitor family protein|nr:Bax inhibitor-1/YccA family protein [Candidatus Phosphoribacter baldrii]HRC12904.1 Bax inhibitor-1/YccA family protein [Dermatophilaceae bacterium]